MPRRYLLSIDSGGIRGIIPAIALVKLENKPASLLVTPFRLLPALPQARLSRLPSWQVFPPRAFSTSTSTARAKYSPSLH